MDRCIANDSRHRFVLIGNGGGKYENVVYAVFLKSIMAKVKDNSAIAFGEYDGTRATVIPKSAAACRLI